MNSSTPEGLSVPAPLMIPVALLLNMSILRRNQQQPYIMNIKISIFYLLLIPGKSNTWVSVMVVNATFNISSVISWRIFGYFYVISSAQIAFISMMSDFFSSNYGDTNTRVTNYRDVFVE